MKASLKFREDQKPLFRAKVPLSILGLPFQSGIVAGESKELSLNFSTFFESGPSLKVAYRPNDSVNPFSLIFKTGIGSFGSPICSPMTMSAEFRLIGNQNPTFFLHFKPQFGDFRIKKSQSSVIAKDSLSKFISNGVASSVDDESIEMVEKPTVQISYLGDNGFLSGKKVSVLPPESPIPGVIKSFLSGMAVSARTALPLKSHAALNFRWGLRLPEEEDAAGVVLKSGRTTGISWQRCPLLVMDKIGIENIAKGGSGDVWNPKDVPGNANLAEACLDVKKQIEFMQAENGLLRKSLDDLKSEISAGQFALWEGGADGGNYRERERVGINKPSGNAKFNRRSNRIDKRSSEMSGNGTESEVNEDNVSTES